MVDDHRTSPLADNADRGETSPVDLLPPSAGVPAEGLLRAWIRRLADGSPIDANAIDGVEVPIVLGVEMLFPWPGSKRDWHALRATCDDNLDLEANGPNGAAILGLRWESGGFASAVFSPPMSALDRHIVEQANLQWGEGWPLTRRVVMVMGAIPQDLGPGGGSGVREPRQPSPAPVEHGHARVRPL